jgi:biopolymer transport protein ExbD
MAEIIQEEKGAKGGKKRPKKHSTNIDMTPMVDLMCLLITFFMLTTAFSKPKVMEIVLPEKIKDTTKVKSPQVPAARTFNIILGKSDVIYWYIGIADPNKPPLPTILKTDFSKDGIRKVLLEKNKDLFKKIYELKEKVKKGELVISSDSLNNAIKKLKSSDDLGPIVLIKADESCKYKDFVDIIDEMAIANIARYAVVDLNPVEKDILSKMPK